MCNREIFAGHAWLAEGGAVTNQCARPVVCYSINCSVLSALAVQASIRRPKPERARQGQLERRIHDSLDVVPITTEPVDARADVARACTWSQA
jgi:hypothetical protein